MDVHEGQDLLLKAWLGWVGAPAQCALVSPFPIWIPHLATGLCAQRRVESWRRMLFVQVGHCAEPTLLDAGRSMSRAMQSEVIRAAWASRAWLWKEHSCDSVPKSAGSAVPNLLIWRYFPCTDDSCRDMRQAHHCEGGEMERFRNMQCLLHSFLLSPAMISP